MSIVHIYDISEKFLTFTKVFFFSDGRCKPALIRSRQKWLAIAKYSYNQEKVATVVWSRPYFMKLTLYFLSDFKVAKMAGPTINTHSVLSS